MSDIELKILTFFVEDRLLKDMYKQLSSLYATDDLRDTFNSLVTLKYIIKTNPRKGKGGSYCVSKRGRALLTTQYVVALEQLLLF